MTDEEEIKALQERVDNLEGALRELWPGWEWGACKPDCSAACCEY